MLTMSPVQTAAGKSSQMMMAIVRMPRTKIDQVEQAVGQSALPPAPEPRPCMFTDKMKDDLEELFGALDNARRWAMHESIFDTAEWKSNGQEIRTKIRAVWSAFSDLQRAAEDSGIFADEEADQ